MYTGKKSAPTKLKQEKKSKKEEIKSALKMSSYLNYSEIIKNGGSVYRHLVHGSQKFTFIFNERLFNEFRSEETRKDLFSAFINAPIGGQHGTSIKILNSEQIELKLKGYDLRLFGKKNTEASESNKNPTFEFSNLGPGIH